MSGSIFLVQDSGALVEMRGAPYDSESVLQQLLASYPNLLAGDQIDSESPRRWLLVKREMGIPGEENGGGRWSVDHLFLDQDSIPTLVEVKRSTDTRIRREVIGQMMDYAANAVVYWPVESLQTAFVQTCQAQQVDPEDRLTAFLGGGEPELFWQKVKVNLQAGKVRLVFVADEIPSELRRVIEFLNGTMDPVEVLGIEIKQFLGEGMRTLVPRVIGQTEAARTRKNVPSGARVSISEAGFFDNFDAERPAQERHVARRIIEWAKSCGMSLDFKKGQRGSTFVPAFEINGGPVYPISLGSHGRFVIQMRWLRDRPPFNDATKREELLQRCVRVNGFDPAGGMEGFPRFVVSELAEPQNLDRAMSVLNWMVEQLRNA